MKTLLLNPTTTLFSVLQNETEKIFACRHVKRVFQYKILS